MKQVVVIILIVSFFACTNNTSNKDQGALKESEKSYVLTEVPARFPHCGIIKNLVAFKFKSFDNDRQLIFCIPCPELYGEKYFVKDEIYKVQFGTRDEFKEYVIINSYQNENLPTYEIANIKQVNQ